MKLRSSPTSPFVRKVIITAIETGLDGRIEQIATNAWADDTDLFKDNPLCKVPALVTDGGEVLYDSPVICEYLDSLHDGLRLFPAAGAARWRALRLQALADGVMEAALNAFVENNRRPEGCRWTAWTERQLRAVGRGLAALEEESLASDRFTIAEVAVAAALGYLDLRFADLAWRDGHPALAAWQAAIADRPSVAGSAPGAA